MLKPVTTVVLHSCHVNHIIYLQQNDCVHYRFLTSGTILNSRGQ